jgi:MoaA/NifB/PqqE/SkfB family radical SAM enzyme
LDQATELFESLAVSLTGGEPLLHESFEGVVDSITGRGIPYRFVTNGWFLSRVVPLLRYHKPESVRLSLSGASEETHDRERGRGSFRRVLTGVALLTNDQVPCYLSMVVDRRVIHELSAAVELAESLGCLGMSFILPQPTPGSASRDSDLGPSDWRAVTRKVRHLAGSGSDATEIKLDYGYPFDGDEMPCETLKRERVYVDARGRLCECCQLSAYGCNETEVVADLNQVQLAHAMEMYDVRMIALSEERKPDPASPRVTDAFPCLRCAAARGKLKWLCDYPLSPWFEVSRHGHSAKPRRQSSHA